jgi:septal ring factor EnvC (AmiA/AmiB activator)
MPGCNRTAKVWFIRDPAGEGALAIAAGRVIDADWQRGSGGLPSVFSAVRQGEPTARAGASGESREPGLYFEIRHQGTAVDPAAWIGR